MYPWLSKWAIQPDCYICKLVLELKLCCNVWLASSTDGSSAITQCIPECCFNWLVLLQWYRIYGATHNCVITTYNHVNGDYGGTPGVCIEHRNDPKTMTPNARSMYSWAGPQVKHVGHKIEHSLRYQSVFLKRHQCSVLWAGIGHVKCCQCCWCVSLDDEDFLSLCILGWANTFVMISMNEWIWVLLG